ncbi:short chain enoyl-CoA hydratase; Enoyl-CoA hydratase [Desulfobulbus propionicus DSM 2032]|jgi:enoyl-CoA hydratase/carnithine racemase|uniref:Short chain enoyl-CoA hydratase Enoyl-CoA hydratase n=1 Tax=Desulfobulbus propionicus (strain ATCC 33891 / DSM 2032 / VKM B-1956 / 1pr3) TaxID=577650 RepID=A0A7U3YK24_DESPD|nr:enoyl-CoA hydratase-related protein [Desulfobulbus propionicus]ADW16830.1 short chain enoyl-CoA hydratase; Enoyl-CoA hydratase [Desulfobulbus propionicus DSM 2032]
MEYKEILFEVDEGIATLTLNRADIRNAITHPDMIAEIKSACDQVNSHLDIRVLILTAVDPAFSSGGNVKDMKERKGMFAGTPAEIVEQYRKNLQEVLLSVYNVEIPTIAAINGSAVGAGCGLALMCDIRVASRKATFGETFLNVGLIPGDGSAFTLPRVIGMAKASELIFTAETIDADAALDLGLINHVVDHEELLAKSRNIAAKIAGRPPQAVRLTKKLLRLGPQSTLEQSMLQAAAYQSLCHFTDDHMEALNAMFEKRKPLFQGK